MSYSDKYEYIYLHPIAIALMVSTGASCICCYPIVFFYAVKHKTYHLNFKIIWNLIGICLSMFSIGFILSTIYDKTCETDCSKTPIFFILKHWQSFFHRTERCLLIGLFFERLFASIFYEIYERKRLLFIPVLINFFSFITGGIWFFLSLIKVINDITNVAIHIAALLLSLTGILILYIVNKKKEMILERKLSARFIIKDNIRTVKLLLVPLFISNVTEIIGCILLQIGLLYMQDYVILLIKFLYLTMAFQPLSWIVYVIRKNRKNTFVKPINIVNNKEKAQEESDCYFINLQKQWNS